VWVVFEDAVGSVAKMFGVPMQSIMRDMRALVSTGKRIVNSATGQSQPINANVVRQNLLEDLHVVPDEFFGIRLVDKTTSGYVDRIYEAYKRGDTKTAEDLTEYLVEGKGIKEKTIPSKLKAKLREDYVNERISMDDAIAFSEAHGLWKSEKEAYTALIEAADKALHTDEDEYKTSAYINVYNAALAQDRSGYNTAVQEMVAHGYTEKGITSKVKSQIGSWYADGEIQESQATALLKFIGITDSTDIYWSMDQWKYNQTKDEDDGSYSKNHKLYDAIDSGSGLQAAIQELVTHSSSDEKKTKASLASAITSHYKDEYVALIKAGKTGQAANLQARLLTAYEQLGYNRAKKLKDIQKWAKD
jgi:hypothetical protein